MNESAVQSDFNPYHSEPLGGESNVETLTPVAPRSELQQLDTTGQKVPDEKDIARIAKSFEPLINKIVSVADAAGIRLVSRRAKGKGFNEEQVEAIAEKVTMSDETHALITTSSARIAARYIKDPIQLDFAALASGLLDWTTGITTALRELGKLPTPVTIIKSQKEDDENED